MKKIMSVIKTGEDFDRLLKLLADRVSDNKAVSENAMLDGFIIGLLYSTIPLAKSLFLGCHLGRVLDGSLQKLEQIVVWVTNNEDELIKILKNRP